MARDLRTVLVENSTCWGIDTVVAFGMEVLGCCFLGLLLFQFFWDGRFRLFGVTVTLALKELSSSLWLLSPDAVDPKIWLFLTLLVCERDSDP